MSELSCKKNIILIHLEGTGVNCNHYDTLPPLSWGDSKSCASLCKKRTFTEQKTNLGYYLIKRHVNICFAFHN